MIMQPNSLGVPTLMVAVFTKQSLTNNLSDYRKSSTSTGVMSAAPATYHDKSSNYLNSVIPTAENHMVSSSTLAKETTNGTTDSKTSTVLGSGSVLSLSEPTVATVDTPAAVPHVAGKPLKSVGNENKSSGGNAADRVKINIKNQPPIDKNLKFLTSTASTTAVAPIIKSTKPTSSASKPETSAVLASTGRPSTVSSHKRSSSFHRSMLFC